ncbi:hypothetical protein [Verrucomicrobium sp. BvORR034]|uniref:hypothetical protein n=1 Tax=Verrucomicrobium sp. BvORR034 TaxID=1396418 RepID=UPI000678E753|nr:hypothetical protein [Verrucomicrobium sp. BvORR034]
MPTISDPTAAQAPTSRRVLIVVVTLTLSLVTALTAFLVIYDIEPPDASDMAPVPTAKTPESGQINPLEKFLTVLQHRPVDAPPPRKKAPAATGPSPQETVLNNRALVLKAYEELLQTNPTSWRWPTEHGESLETSLDHQLKHLMPVANLIRVQAGLEESTSPEESALTTLSLAKFSHGLNNAGGLLIHNMVASAIQRTAVLQLERPLALNAISSASLMKIQKQLEDLDPSLIGFIATLKAEYVFAAEAYRATKSGVALEVDPRKLDLKGYPEPLKSMLLKTNLTLATRLEMHRQLIKGLETNWKAAFDAHQTTKQNLDKIFQSPVRFWLNPNTTGIAFSVLDAQDLQDSLIRQMGHATIHRQVILQVALRRYEVDHHRLPDDLSELSPAYLASIPQDPFTDLPMRWNPGTQVLYSVGVNGSDDGGAFRIPVTIDERDIGQYYWWSKAASKARDAQRLAPPEAGGRPGVPAAP